jgi:ComF family protein
LPQKYSFMASSKVRQLAEDFVSLIFPRVCAACAGELMRNEDAICLACLLEMPRTFDERDPVENPLAKVFWGRIPLKAAVSGWIFTQEGKVQELVHNLKYNGRKDAGIAAGRIFGNDLKNLTPFNKIDFVVPVPLHKEKEFKRGYNQAEMFGKGLSDQMNIPLAHDLLKRLKATDTQTKKSRSGRWDNVETVFGLNQKYSLVGKHILLVDDVITTGATIEACAQILVNAEAIVSVASLAAARD